MRKIVICIVICCLSFMCAVPAVSMTINELQRQAQRGDAEAQYYLAVMYLSGVNVRQNYSEGQKWLRKAADQGHEDALCLLGLCYYDGDMGFRRNYAQAAKYLAPAANKGYVEAQFALADLYFNGEGVKRNLPQAFKLYLSAASQGMPEAQHNVGVMYYNGYGVKRNTSEAIKWWKTAAKNGNQEASQALRELQAAQNQQRQLQELQALGALGEILGLFSGGYDSYQSSGRRESPSERGTECYYCFKTGSCQTCKGTGRVTKANYKYNPETDPDSWMTYEDTCNDCQGTGRCEYCGGSGIIR